VRLTERIGRLGARAPNSLKRVVLVWISPDGRTIKAADTHPHLPDDGRYIRYLTPYDPARVNNVAQAN
jgi:hypothetical protein